MNKYAQIASALLGCAALTFCGCGSGGAGGNGNTVEGAVTYKGSAVPGAKVKLIATTKKDGAAREYESMTNSEGKYLISGPEPGNYKVVIYKLLDPSGKPLNPDETGIDFTQLEMSGMGKHALPKIYAEDKSTPLELTVKSGETKKDFALKD